ncbi:hypothetical protein BaRGS_00015003 [Batillaria attramentaria]|uniref:Alpha-type protein kinase domain-containing protein n=1 Tax=Batillaria attramentaria TaxID=370345 RepID=A0ABD0L376_9CAEN
MASVSSILRELGYSTTAVDTDVAINDFGDDADRHDVAAESLQKWLALLPGEVTSQIELAKRHAVPFMPPGVTPEMLSSRNANRCLDIAMRSQDYQTASALVFVVDRALYRFGRSKPVLRVACEIQRASPDTAIAPQVILRQARVMKDDGDLNGAMRIIQAIINKDHQWPYQSEQQYLDTKAACLHVEGQIYHNLELWREAVHPLVEAVRIFRQVGDKKGISSCLTVLSRCVPRLDHDDYQEIRRRYPDVFQSLHPCYEGYQQGICAVRFVEHIEARFFAAKHQLVADESLLMFTVQQQSPQKQHNLLHTILGEVKRSLAGHRAVQFLNSVEAFVEFVRGVFMVSQVLSFSCVCGDKDVARFYEKVAIELYQFMSSRPLGEGVSEPSGSLKQTVYSVSLMDLALKLLGLPLLEGSEEIWRQQEEEEHGSFNRGTLQDNTAAVGTIGSAISVRNLKGENSSQFAPNGAENSGLSETDASDPSYARSYPAASAYSRPADERFQPRHQSHTFPEVSSRKPQACHKPGAGRRSQRKFVGLPMTLEELRASTCPALSPEALESLSLEEDHLELAEEDLEALSVSAQTFSSKSSGRTPSDLVSDLRVLTDLPSDVSTPKENDRAANNKAQETHAAQTSTNPPMDKIPTDMSEADGYHLHDTAERVAPKGPRLRSEETATTNSDGERLVEAKSEVSTVDLSKTTKSLSPSFSSCSSSSLVDLEATTKSSSASANSPVLSPLVDLSASSSKSLMLESMNLGECSVDTEDPQEFLANWIPSADTGVHRALLYTFNPETKGQPWSCQTTLAYLGPKLQTDRKGSFRDAYHISLLHQDEPLGRYVGKRYRQQRKPADYMRDVECQMIAGYFVTRFNQRLSAAPKEFLRLQNEEGEVFNWVNVEPYLQGSFLKLTNNHRYVSKRGDLEDGVEVATAFTHFSFVETHGRLMVVDLQGWVPSAGRGVIYLTDPVLHTRSDVRICSGNRHEEGMRQFWEHVHPTCNKICRFLGLDNQRPEVLTW